MMIMKVVKEIVEANTTKNVDDSGHGLELGYLGEEEEWNSWLW